MSARTNSAEHPGEPPDVEQLHADPNGLAPHYSRFAVQRRLLLTGHSHQAWPDVGFEGQAQAWTDAAELVDRKWPRALEMARRVRRGFARLADDPHGSYTLGSSTHELMVRLLSALPLARRPRIVTTDGEFHSLRRQLRRLEEEGLQVVRVPAVPASEVAGALAEAADERTCAVMVSSVFYETAQIVSGLGELAQRCQQLGCELVVDAYHSLNVAPFSITDQQLQQAFVVGGGYKYCQLGEGNAFLRAPAECALRPVITGWFAELESLGSAASQEPVSYGDGAPRFAGATYDPTSHYRGARVLRFFQQQGLTPALLRQVSQHQMGLLASTFDALDLPPSLIRRDHTVALESIAGFLALQTPHAAALQDQLRQRGVHVDHRGSRLRLGPAPYLSDRQLRDAMGILGQLVRDLERGTVSL